MHYQPFFTSLAMGLFLLGVAESSAKEPTAYGRGVLIRFEGEIGPGLQAYLYRKLDVAKEQGADLVIVEIDSPGGLLKESLEIARHLQALDWAHTVAYVPQRAVSGAAIVSLGCDEILMARSAEIGDAGAIFMDENSVFSVRSPEGDQLSRPCPAEPRRSQRKAAGAGRGHGRQGSPGLSCSQSEDRPGDLCF